MEMSRISSTTSSAADSSNSKAVPLITSTTSSWPSVFDESYEMILAAIMIYGIVDLRTLAREGLIDGRLMSVPISSTDIVQLVMQNRSAIYDNIGYDAAALYLDAFDSISQQEQEGFEVDYNSETGETSLVSFDVVDVGDDNSKSELVYGICVHQARRRITVIFRGCTTRKDWSVSVETFLTECENPLFEDSNDARQNLPRTLSIHRGFHRYLFGTNGDNDDNKFQSIIKKLDHLLSDYPDYDIYVTGHSLGGALCTVFAFYAAATAPTLLGPITCIPIASPMVGNLSFETTFSELEYQGRLRCLRITNHFDIFTQLPDRALSLYAFAWCFGWHMVQYLSGSFLFFLCCQHRVYRHVGMDLHLYKKNTGYKIKHSRGTPSNYWWRVIQDVKTHFKQTLQRMMTVPFVCFCNLCFCKEDFNANHSIKEHLLRLQDLSDELESVHLNDLYQEKRFKTQRIRNTASIV